MLGCKEYSFLVKDDVLFANGCYGLYKLNFLSKNSIFSLKNFKSNFIEWYLLFISFMKDLSSFSDLI